MSILKSKAFDDNLRQEYAKNPSDLMSYKKYKALIQRVIIHLAKGTSPSPFSFKYNDDKRIIMEDRIRTMAYGHYRVGENRK